MSCIEIHLQRVESSVELKRKDTSFLSLEETAPSWCTLTRVLEDISACLERIHSCITLQRQPSGVLLERVCDISNIPYLEIEPEFIWVYPDFEVDNDVYSNLTWNIN